MTSPSDLTLSVLEPLPSLEDTSTHYEVASSVFGSKGFLKLFLSGGKPSLFGTGTTEFPGEMIYGHVEFTPNGDHTIDSVNLYVKGEIVPYKEEGKKWTEVGQDGSLYSHQTIYKWGNMNHKLVIHRQGLDGERTFTYT